VRAYDEWKKGKSIKLLVGTRLVTIDGFEVLAYPTDRKAYGRLCRLLTEGNLKANKGQCHLTFGDIVAASEGQMLIALPPPTLFSAAASFPGRGAARSGAPLIRDRRKLGVSDDPGSAAHHSATLRAALRPGNAVEFICCSNTRSRPTAACADSWRRAAAAGWGGRPCACSRSAPRYSGR
jgi:hypothetical protein